MHHFCLYWGICYVLAVWKARKKEKSNNFFWNFEECIIMPSNKCLSLPWIQIFLLTTWKMNQRCFGALAIRVLPQQALLEWGRKRDDSLMHWCKQGNKSSRKERASPSAHLMRITKSGGWVRPLPMYRRFQWMSLITGASDRIASFGKWLFIPATWGWPYCYSLLTIDLHQLYIYIYFLGLSFLW